MLWVASLLTERQDDVSVIKQRLSHLIVNDDLCLVPITFNFHYILHLESEVFYSQLLGKVLIDLSASHTVYLTLR